MAGNIFDNPTLSIMYQDALQSLYNGCVMPWERDLLAQAPLPADMVDPFASEDVKPLSVMNLTYVSLSGWIADAKKEKYYSERFVQLSKLVMKGVSTMARGLVTLHQRGEELSAAPMQIEDLISVGSYHFRKSYLGVVQFSSKHPEIGERLLVNQLGWATTLMRLYKTKEKLSENKKSEIRNKKSNGNEEESTENKKSEARGDGYCAAALPAHKNCHHVRKMMNEDISPDEIPDVGPDSGESLTGQVHEETVPNISPDTPPYLQILQNVFGRSGPSETCELTFTFDELCYLAADPDFAQVYPEQAAQMRSILQQMDSS